MKILVLDSNKKPLMPCWPNRAYELIRKGRASLFRRFPETIIIHDRVQANSVLQEIELKVDPGSKTTGIVLVVDGSVAVAINLAHRGASIKSNLIAKAQQRRARRARKTRYRQARFENRSKPPGWLPPSLQSRVDNVKTWADRLVRYCPISSVAVETVRFDMQKMMTPGIAGVQYQQGTLMGYEVREYLLEKWNRTCAYCDAKNVPFEIEHIVPKKNPTSSNRISNLTIACHPCNQAKGSISIEIFLARQPKRLAKILAQAKRPLSDAAAVNATRFATGDALKSLGLPTTFWSGGRTKMKRIAQGYAKDHWIDAACVGETGVTVTIAPKMTALQIASKGRGSRQRCNTDKYGFPLSPRAGITVGGFKGGDLVQLSQPRGKYAGTHTGHLAGVRVSGRVDIVTMLGKVTAPIGRLMAVQQADGYRYAA